jgi:hypothetical protein
MESPQVRPVGPPVNRVGKVRRLVQELEASGAELLGDPTRLARIAGG